MNRACVRWQNDTRGQRQSSLTEDGLASNYARLQILKATYIAGKGPLLQIHRPYLETAL